MGAKERISHTVEVLACHLFLQLLDALGFVLRQNLTHHATFGDSHLRFKGMDFVGSGVACETSQDLTKSGDG